MLLVVADYKHAMKPKTYKFPWIYTYPIENNHMKPINFYQLLYSYRMILDEFLGKMSMRHEVLPHVFFGSGFSAIEVT